MASIEMLEARKSEILGDLKKIVDTADSFSRGLSSGEIAKEKILSKSLKEISKKLKEAHSADELRGRIAKADPTLTGTGNFYTSDSNIYNPESRDSYFFDLYKSGQGDSSARERLDRHSMQFRADERTRNVPEFRAASTTAGSGGEFAPPLWLIDKYIAAVRPARATADAVTKLLLPPGQDLINVPKIATGTAVALQNLNNSGVNIQDITTTTVAAPVLTVAGGLVFSLQMFEQSPMAGGIDKVILSDLAADYARQIGSLVINGTGLSGQPTGLLTAAANTIAYTDATPGFMGAGKLYAKIGQAIQTIQTSRYLAPTAIVMHPRRWAWCATQVDSAGRAVILPNDNGPLNASSVQQSGNAEGYVGKMFGLSVLVDPNIPTNLGTGLNQDPIIVLKADDTWLYEGPLNTQVFSETFSNNLSLFARVYAYFALANRLGSSIAVINGTGLVTPTF